MSSYPNEKERIEFARSVMDEATNSLNEGRSKLSSITVLSIKDIRTWQRFLATIIFAVLGAMIPVFYSTGKLPPHKLTFLVGIILLFFDGIYLTNKQLRVLEKELRELSVGFPKLERLLHTRIDAAAKAFLDPSDANMLKIKEAGDNIIDQAGLDLTNRVIKERPSFTNDIVIGLFTLSTMLLLRGLISSKTLFWTLFILALAYYVVRAWLDTLDISKSKKIKLESIADLLRNRKK